MSRFLAAAQKFVRDEEGATAVEYALMIALILWLFRRRTTLPGRSFARWRAARA